MTDQQLQGERLKALLIILKISQTTLAQRIGVTRGYVSILVSGDKPISQKILNGLLKAFPKVNTHWLMSGKGEPILPDEPVKNYQIEGGAPRTLQDLEEDYRNDPLFALKEVLKDYEERITALEHKVTELQERSTKVGDKEKT